MGEAARAWSAIAHVQLDSGSITDQDRDKIQIHSYCSNVTDINCSSIHTNRDCKANDQPAALSQINRANNLTTASSSIETREDPRAGN